MFSSRKKSDQLRIIGRGVLALGIVAAGIFYLIATHGPAAEDPNTILVGYTRASEHAMRVQMGTMGLILLGWQDALARPGIQALIIAAVAALFSCYFFRAAWVLDDDERDRLRMETHPPQ